MTVIQHTSSVDCPLCQHTVAALFVRAKDFNHRTTGKAFTYYRCADCGLIFLSPIPSDLGCYYAADYYRVPSSLEELARLAEAERFKIELVGRFVRSGRLVEIGSGYGGFAYLAKQAGFQVEAIELDGRCCQFIAEVIGVRAICSVDTSTSLGDVDPCDVIALWHVLEHLVDWRATLQVATEKLLPGGILVIATPNPEAFQFRVFRHHWAHLDTPRHVQLIPPSLLAAQLQVLGLRQVLFTTTDQGSVEYNVLGWDWSMRSIFPVRGTHTLGRILAKILTPVERAGRHGSCYTAVFQKN